MITNLQTARQVYSFNTAKMSSLPASSGQVVTAVADHLVGINQILTEAGASAEYLASINTYLKGCFGEVTLGAINGWKGGNA